MRTASISLSLPSSHTYGIGRIVVCWANVELRLGQIAYEARALTLSAGGWPSENRAPRTIRL